MPIIFHYLDTYNSSRYLRDVPLSVLSSIPQSRVHYDANNSNDGSATDSNTDVMKIKEDESNIHTSPQENMNPVEFFISSDGSAILEHTNRVIYLEVLHL